MALQLPSLSETIDVIAKIDSAIATTPDDLYEQYLATGDETLLTLTQGEEPTRFVMRKVLPYNLSQKVQSEMVKMSGGGEVNVSLTFMAEEVRCSLIDIKNPATLASDKHIRFTKDGDGGASKELMAQLVGCGVAMNLFSARKARESAKKNP
jgi:hypothetical protein